MISATLSGQIPPLPSSIGCAALGKSSSRSRSRKGKLYVCRIAHYHHYKSVKGGDWMAPYPWKETLLLDTPLIWFHQPLTRRIMAHLRGKIGL